MQARMDDYFDSNAKKKKPKPFSGIAHVAFDARSLVGQSAPGDEVLSRNNVAWLIDLMESTRTELQRLSESVNRLEEEMSELRHDR